MDEGLAGVIVGALLTFLLTVCFIPVTSGNVTSGEQFILEDATYICKKTNELTEGEQK